MREETTLSSSTAMSKEAGARIRDELLQSLYAGVLRCTFALLQAGVSTARGGSEAVAAGVCTNLRAEDMLLLPARGALSFRVLRGLGAQTTQNLPVRDLVAGVLTLPKEEASAVALALGAAAAAAHGGVGALIVAVLPARHSVLPPRSGKTPATWSEAAAYAARFSLPLLLVSEGSLPARRVPAVATPAHLLPESIFPSIPVDRGDALAIYRVAFECAARARAGGGPSHIDCMPFRVRGQGAPETDALGMLETALRKRSAFSKAWRRRLERQLS
jgi:hypothetical protein